MVIMLAVHIIFDFQIKDASKSLVSVGAFISVVGMLGLLFEK